MSEPKCPTHGQLGDLIAGRLSSERHQAIDEHVSACPACQAQVDTIEEPRDAFLTTLHEAFDPAVIQAQQPYQQLVVRLLSFGNGLADGAIGETRSLRPKLVGEQLGDFDVVAEIGRGGMGIVYEARQLSLGRRVALKILPFEELAGERRVQRFENEARAAARLTHAHIVSIYGVGNERGLHYIAMQLVDGLNLAQLIEMKKGGGNSSRLPPGGVLLDAVLAGQATDANYIARIVVLGIQAAQALDYAREQGIVHRDIKPSNLMIDYSGKL